MVTEPRFLRSYDPSATCDVRRLLAISQLALLAATWKLWTPQTVFPQVPLLRTLCDWPGWCDWICLSTLVGASTVLLIVPGKHLASRLSSASMAISLAGLFVLDQHRLQPWAWQFFLLSILLSLADAATTRRGWICLTISIYFWSAISKIDYTFFHDQGPALVEGFKHAVGIPQATSRYGATLDVIAAVVLALGELSVAMLLVTHRTRRLGIWFALLMHASLLVALGPLGLKHSWGVLLWNVFFAAQTWLLFRRSIPQSSVIAAAAPNIDGRAPKGRWGNRLAFAVIVGAVSWPLLEPVGGCDHWLAWAVYSARAGQSEVLVESDEPLPGSIEYDQVIRSFGGRTAVAYRAKVATWSLKELGVPIYPQFRFHAAVGRYLQQQFQRERVIVTNQKHNRWNGQPSDFKVIDLQPNEGDLPQQEDMATLFFWNIHPRWMQSE